MDKEDLLSLYGDWFYADHLRQHRKWSIAIANKFAIELAVKSVIDFGCGIGSHLEGFQAAGVKVLKGYEVCLKNAIKYIPENIEEFISEYDATIPLENIIKYDCAMSIEVAEHIPIEKSDALIDNITRSASRLIVFTAAPPGQPGTGHINCQSKDFWVTKFKDRGWNLNNNLVALTQQLWRNDAPYYIIDNLMIFVL